MYRNKSLKIYLNDLAAKLPAPGGGSAAALTAAEGSALISMVVNFTLGKSKYARYHRDLLKALAGSEKIRARFIELVDLDVAAFKSKDINKSLSVPLEIARLCFDALKLCPPLVKKGNINLISDVAVAAILLEAGFSSALFNVRINLKYLKNRKRRDKINKELDKKKSGIIKIRRNLEERIDEIIRR
ncbi:MAG: cyclodeaminase/cyclohydrolase family protein [Candidatus Omnitrophica bacterium]|nr:cyclodeaminase/cyclohydrolase family protein [Candidatus Omnitrophota bacterium]MBU1871352.1 cyclodeaminase/cyclohydrolase family protein [Candidatus Omnitrophota bacterium]